MRKSPDEVTAPRGISRRNILKAAGTAAAAVPLVGGLSGAAQAAGTRKPVRPHCATSFYVSSAGSDTANGLSTSTPWRTVSKVNQALSAGTIVRGDCVSFRQGDEFFGTINSIPVAAVTDPVLTFGSYGSGARPRISNYKVCSSSAGWSQDSTNLWKIDISAGSGAYTGNTTSTNVNVGFIRVNGVIKGFKKFDLASVANDWDFYDDGTKYLYVHLGANPALSGDVRAAVDGNIFTAQSAVAVRGLELCGSGGHGFRAPAPDGSITLDNSVIHEIGGSQLIYNGGPPLTRYGNGIEIWIGASDISITGNQVYDVYDVGVTYQGSQVGAQLGWTNVHATNNTIHNCTQSFEMWSDGTNMNAGSGFVNCSFANNTCSSAGSSWGAAVRPDTAGKSTHLLFYDTQLPTDLAITGNTFYDAVQNYCYLSSTNPPAGMVVDNNVISLRAGTKLQYQRAQTIEQAAAWTAASGMDAHSTFKII